MHQQLNRDRKALQAARVAAKGYKALGLMRAWSKAMRLCKVRLAALEHSATALHLALVWNGQTSVPAYKTQTAGKLISRAISIIGARTTQGRDNPNAVIMTAQADKKA